MFKEEYKQHYDKIHPSQELIEKTKKLAIEQYQQSLGNIQKRNTLARIQGYNGSCRSLVGKYRPA